MSSSTGHLQDNGPPINLRVSHHFCALVMTTAFVFRCSVANFVNSPSVGSKAKNICSSGTGNCVQAAKASRELRASMQTDQRARNVLGGPLELCCNSPKTGFYRDGFCHTGPQDFGMHTVCARVTTEFLEYSKAQGNDLITPAPQYGFPGLKDGDGWCLCASRWLEAAEVGKAPPIVLASTHEKTLQTVPLDLLKKYAIDV